MTMTDTNVSEPPTPSPADEPDTPPGGFGVVRTSPELGSLFAALSAAQGELTDPAKNKVADTGKSGKYRYSDLADLLQIIRPVFARHGLCILQFPVSRQSGTLTIITWIGHSSGQWMSGDLTMLVPDDKPQTLGSIITYLRRYSVGAITGISPDDDEDGQLAQTAARDAPQQRNSGWQSQRSEKPAAAQGAMAAAAAAAQATPKPGAKPRLFNVEYPGDRAWLRAKCEALNIAEEYYERLGQAFHGTPTTAEDFDLAVKKVLGSQ